MASSYASKISSGSTDQNATVSTYKVNNTKVVPSTDSMVAKSGPNSIADGMVSNVVTFEPVIENAGDFCDP